MYAQKFLTAVGGRRSVSILHRVAAGLLAGFLFFTAACSYAQDVPTNGTPLAEVLDEIENRFGIKLEYPAGLVNEYWIEGKSWTANEDPEQSLVEVLTSHRLMFLKEGDRSYRVVDFEIGRRTVEEGRAQLAYLSHRYDDRTGWEVRKRLLRHCMYEALQLSPLPPGPDNDPIITGRRAMDGYTVENVAIETLPGLFVTCSLYRPLSTGARVPVVLSPNGHFDNGRYRPDQQYRMAMLARMGAMAFSYDLFGWGESLLQFDSGDHRTALAMSIQVLNGVRILDYLAGLEEADTSRIAVTGGSGGGSQTMLLTALDERIDVSVPVVMLSSYFNGGCPCENGRPVHYCAGGTSNVEIAAMAAPRPQLVISDGDDWTAHVPEIAYPWLREIYGYYGKRAAVQNVHLPDEGHDYGRSKRLAMYDFMASHLGLNIEAVKDEQGNIDESACRIEDASALRVFGREGKRLPGYAIQDFEALQQVFDTVSSH